MGKPGGAAAGGAFEKVAKPLALGSPGGPVIDKLARHGNPNAVSFTRPKMKGNPLDFSFSGIKTAVLRYVESHDLAKEIEDRRRWRQPFDFAHGSTFAHGPELAEGQNLSVGAVDLLAHTSQQTLDLVASFQKAVVEDLAEHCLQAAERESVNSIFVTGGVAANSLLRERLLHLRGKLPPVYFPRLGLSTDNAAMIAAAAFPKFQARQFAAWDTPPDASLALESEPRAPALPALSLSKGAKPKGKQAVSWNPSRDC